LSSNSAKTVDVIEGLNVLIEDKDIHIVRKSIEAEFTGLSFVSLIRDLQNPYLMIAPEKNLVKHKTKTPKESKPVKITYDDFDMDLGHMQQ
jgi:hypothetical protein